MPGLMVPGVAGTAGCRSNIAFPLHLDRSSTSAIAVDSTLVVRRIQIERDEGNTPKAKAANHRRSWPFRNPPIDSCDQRDTKRGYTDVEHIHGMPGPSGRTRSTSFFVICFLSKSFLNHSFHRASSAVALSWCTTHGRPPSCCALWRDKRPWGLIWHPGIWFETHFITECLSSGIFRIGRLTSMNR